MTHLRTMMLEELERRNFAETTKDCYIWAVEDFARYFMRPPDQLGPEHIRQFQAHLFTMRRMAPNTVNQRLAALRFFFVKTLHRTASGSLSGSAFENRLTWIPRIEGRPR